MTQRGLHRLAVLATGAVLATASLASAQPQATPPAYDPRAAFAEADTNHDGAVDHEEFVARITEVFYRADTDKNGQLTPTETSATLTETRNLTAADSDGNGTLTLHEFIRARLKDYDQTDTNGNGLLEVDEVVSVYQRPAP